MKRTRFDPRRYSKEHWVDSTKLALQSIRSMDQHRIVTNRVRSIRIQQEHDDNNPSIKGQDDDPPSARRKEVKTTSVDVKEPLSDVKVKAASPDILPYKLDQVETIDIPSDTSSTDQIVKKEDEQ